jgi:hypothetical protein
MGHRQWRDIEQAKEEAARIVSGRPRPLLKT